jgi:hypothetical protein
VFDQLMWATDGFSFSGVPGRLPQRLRVAVTAALVAVAVEILLAAGVVSMSYVGGLAVPVSVVPAAVACLFWYRRPAPAPIVPVVVLAVTVSMAAVFLVSATSPGFVVSVLFAAAGEELVFRVAVVLVVLAVVSGLGCSRRLALVAALVVSTVTFTLQPGHLDQAAARPVALLVYAAVALVFSGLVLSGRLVAAVVSHVALNAAVLTPGLPLVPAALVAVSVVAADLTLVFPAPAVSETTPPAVLSSR